MGIGIGIGDEAPTHGTRGAATLRYTRASWTHP